MTIGPYIDRLFDDDYVREQIGDALVSARRAYRRARAQRAAQAASDQKLLAHVSRALGSLQQAGRALAGRPAPKPSRRRLRTAALFGVAMAGAAAAVYVDRRESRRDGAATAPAGEGTAPPPAAASPVQS